MEPTNSWFLVEFVSPAAQWELPPPVINTLHWYSTFITINEPLLTHFFLIKKNFFFCFFFFFLGPHLRHMEVPRLGVESELHSNVGSELGLRPTPQLTSRQCWIPNH